MVARRAGTHPFHIRVKHEAGVWITVLENQSFHLSLHTFAHAEIWSGAYLKPASLICTERMPKALLYLTKEQTGICTDLLFQYVVDPLDARGWNGLDEWQSDLLISVRGFCDLHNLVTDAIALLCSLSLARLF